MRVLFCVLSLRRLVLRRRIIKFYVNWPRYERNVSLWQSLSEAWIQPVLSSNALLLQVVQSLLQVLLLHSQVLLLQLCQLAEQFLVYRCLLYCDSFLGLVMVVGSRSREECHFGAESTTKSLRVSLVCQQYSSLKPFGSRRIMLLSTIWHSSCRWPLVRIPPRLNTYLIVSSNTD